MTERGGEREGRRRANSRHPPDTPPVRCVDGCPWFESRRAQSTLYLGMLDSTRSDSAAARPRLTRGLGLRADYGLDRLADGLRILPT
jgi:hypothetical protein